MANTVMKCLPPRIAPLWLTGMVKMSTIGLILYQAHQAASLQHDSTYISQIQEGLWASALGDLALIFKNTWKPAIPLGMLAFAAGHVQYIRAFSQSEPGNLNISTLPLAIIGALGMKILWPHLKSHSAVIRLGVPLYTGALLSMGHQAYAHYKATGDWRPAAGAGLFVASDLILALSMFVPSLKDRVLLGAFVSATYFPAQWLIAQSSAPKKYTFVF